MSDVATADAILRGLGERRIVSELLEPRYRRVKRFGDDSASVALPPEAEGGLLVATTDPCPPPMAQHLGVSDWYYTGWLLATINLSDLAAAGAEPLGLLTSLELKSEMLVVDFERLLDGVDDCCSAADTFVVGGNLKEVAQPNFSATAFGWVDGRGPLGRHGAEEGDAILVIGDLGRFWAGALGVIQGLLTTNDAADPLLRNVLVPRPKVRLMSDLRRGNVVKATIDNSDGLYPSLLQIARANGLGASITFDGVPFEPDVARMAARLNIDPLRLALGWGDWQIIVACSPQDVAAIRSTCTQAETACNPIGVFTNGEGIQLTHGGNTGSMMRLDSQRFTSESWFSAGLDQYVESLTQAPLFA
ncbi:MAG TPA: thiamine-phosphate kinase [Gaiellaceae bacterium]|nr:thiamine-phosphate kinase [Gaiellaceae bacterium]